MKIDSVRLIARGNKIKTIPEDQNGRQTLITPKPYYVYMLECRNGRLYTGITTNMHRRMTEHNTGRNGARFTHANPPMQLLAAKQVIGRPAALKLEAALKKLKKPQKQQWAAENPLGEPAPIKP